MRFLEPGSRELLAAAGAERVDELGTMRIDRGLVREKLALVPRSSDCARATATTTFASAAGTSCLPQSAGPPS